MSERLRLVLSLADLSDAFERASGETSYYLDIETGELHIVAEETRRMLYALQEMYGAEDGTLDIEAALARRDLGARLKDALRLAQRIEAGYGARYRKVPESDSMAGYADMKAFIESIQEVQLRESLWQVIQGRGAAERFRDALLAHPAEQARWDEFKRRQVHQRVLAWLESEGLELAGTP